MRPDQAARLAEIEELLVEQFILEVDPREWPGFGKTPTEMTQQERGDAHWVRKGAVGTAAAIRSVNDLTDRYSGANSSKDPDTQAQREADLDKQIASKERDAAKLVDQVVARAQAAGRR